MQHRPDQHCKCHLDEVVDDERCAAGSKSCGKVGFHHENEPDEANGVENHGADDHADHAENMILQGAGSVSLHQNAHDDNHRDIADDETAGRTCDDAGTGIAAGEYREADHTEQDVDRRRDD